MMPVGGLVTIGNLMAIRGLVTLGRFLPVSPFGHFMLRGLAGFLCALRIPMILRCDRSRKKQDSGDCEDHSLKTAKYYHTLG